MKITVAVLGAIVAFSAAVQSAAKPVQEPKTRFSSALKCLEAVRYGCHPYMHFEQEMNHRGLSLEYRFDRSRFSKPTGPGEHNLSNYALIPGLRAGKDGVYIMSLNGMNFCPLEEKVPNYYPSEKREPRFHERSCRAFVMDPPLFKTEKGGALGFSVNIQTRPFNFVGADGKDMFGRTESTSRFFFWDRKVTSAAEVRSSQIRQIYWNQPADWDAEGQAAYYGAVAACARAIPAALDYYVPRIKQYHAELGGFFDRVKMPAGLRSMSKFISMDKYLKSQLPKLKAAAESGDPVAVDDFLRASYMVAPNDVPRPPRNIEYWQAQNYLGRSIRGELREATQPLRDSGCLEAANNDAGVKAALDELSGVIQNVKTQENIR